MANRCRKSVMQGHNHWEYSSVRISRYCRNHRMEIASSGLEGDYFDSGKQRVVLRRRLGFIRNFPVWLQKADSVARVHSSK